MAESTNNGASGKSDAGGWIMAGLSAGAMGMQAALNSASDHRTRVYNRWLWHEQQAEAQKQREWSLDMWNRQNAYDTPAAQIQRLKEAGLSPLSYLDNGGQMSSPIDTGSAAQIPSMPQFSNLASAVTNGAEIGRSMYDTWLRLQNDSKRVENESIRTMSEAQYKYALTKSENAMRDGKVEFQGVTINLGKAQKSLTDKQVENLSQQIVESNERINMLRQYARESGARIDLMSWRKFCEEQKLPLEKRLLGQQVILAQQQGLDLKLTRRNRNMLLDAQREDLEQKRPYSNYLMYQQARNSSVDADMKEKYFSKYWKKHQDLDLSIKQEKALQVQGQTKSRFSYAVDRGADTVNNLLQPFTQVFQMYMFKQIGKSKGFNMFPVSSPNPSSSPYPSKTQLSPSDGYSMKQGGWMPQDYFAP